MKTDWYPAGKTLKRVGKIKNVIGGVKECIIYSNKYISDLITI